MCDKQLQKLTKGELIKVITDANVTDIDTRVTTIINARPPRIKTVTQKHISRIHQPISVQSIMKNSSKVIPLSSMSTMGIKYKIVCTLDDTETVEDTSNPLSEPFDELENVLIYILGEPEDRTPKEQELYDRYSESVDYYLIYEIDVHVRESVCSSLKNTLAHCYAYNVEMYNIINEPNTPQFICILFMKMTLEEEFNALFK
jgi:hypothetical protein